MIDFILSQTLICSLLLAALVLGSGKLNDGLGAKNVYYLWLCLPLTLVVAALFGLFPQQTWHEILKYSIFANSPLASVQPTWSMSIQTAVLVVWSLVAICVLLHFVLQHHSYQRQLDIQRSSKVFKGLTVWYSEQCASPQLIGAFKSKIIVPTGFEKQFTVAQQTLILQHEYCHWQQKDPIWNFLGIFVLSLFWFNPLFWYAFKQFKLQQELACDARVLHSESVAMRKQYAMSMVSVSASAGALHFTQNLYSEKYNMKHRIQQIMRHKKQSTLPTVFIAIGLLFCSSASHAWLSNKSEQSGMPIHPIKRVAPEYPVQAAENNIQGWVQLSFNIEPNGTVSDVSVIQAEPKWTFETSAIEAVKQWTYQASGSRQMDMKVQLDFQLDSSASSPEYNDMEVVTVAK